MFIILHWYTGVYKETFYFNIKIAKTMQKSENFIVGESSILRKWQLQRLSGWFHTLILRPGDNYGPKSLQSLLWSNRFYQCFFFTFLILKERRSKLSNNNNKFWSKWYKIVQRPWAFFLEKKKGPLQKNNPTDLRGQFLE